MAGKSYESEAIRVGWRPERCIHVGRCLRELPSVFDLGARPWIDLEGADADAVAAVVELCPSGALTYERLDGAAGESPDEETTVVVARNGPLITRGEIRVEDAAGETLCEDPRVTLCRCGRSANQPFCDNSHRREGFESGAANGIDSEGADCSGPTTITATEDGPLKVKGGLRFLDRRGEVLGEVERAFLCRCGQSQNKPFCDSSHERAGFCSTEPEVIEGRADADSPERIEANPELG